MPKERHKPFIVIRHVGGLEYNLRWVYIDEEVIRHTGGLELMAAAASLTS